MDGQAVAQVLEWVLLHSKSITTQVRIAQSVSAQPGRRPKIEHYRSLARTLANRGEGVFVGDQLLFCERLIGSVCTEEDADDFATNAIDFASNPSALEERLTAILVASETLSKTCAQVRTALPVGLGETVSSDVFGVYFQHNEGFSVDDLHRASGEWKYIVRCAYEMSGLSYKPPKLLATNNGSFEIIFQLLEIAANHPGETAIVGGFIAGVTALGTRTLTTASSVAKDVASVSASAAAERASRADERASDAAARASDAAARLSEAQLRELEQRDTERSIVGSNLVAIADAGARLAGERDELTAMRARLEVMLPDPVPIPDVDLGSKYMQGRYESAARDLLDSVGTDATPELMNRIQAGVRLTTKFRATGGRLLPKGFGSEPTPSSLPLAHLPQPAVAVLPRDTSSETSGFGEDV